MKKITLTIASLFIALMCLGQSIVVTQPKEQDVLYAGEVYDITWDSYNLYPEYINVQHSVSNGFAPVDRNVTYQLMPIESMPSKILISSNLGANNIPSNSHDTLESSRGWYWQFNRKQGYMVSGPLSELFPSNAWEVNIDENTDWKQINDPCSCEIGSDWRIPTREDWLNISYAENWTIWSDPWYSMNANLSGIILPEKEFY